MSARQPAEEIVTRTDLVVTGIYWYNDVEFGPEGVEEKAEAPAPELVASSETATVQA